MKRGLAKAPPPGTKVRLTAYFLKCTGQITGSAGSDRWIVQACACELCASGDFVATNEPLDTSSGYEDQTPEWRKNAKRHIAIGNLEIVGAKPKAADQSDAMGPIKVMR